ncbi:MAG: oxygen-dependent coproporphyrinogen oxidase [Bacteroidetes bacterium]|nr:oxygen-dependent coproporphyrinogen oxidase [Bacteroidota bacterium]
MKKSISNDLIDLQGYICLELEKLDGLGHFKQDDWIREEGGGGRTNTILNGKIIEKGGVAFSEVYGNVTPEMKNQLGIDGSSFFATGLSIVLHPKSPHIPIIHMNIRFFEFDNKNYWFGGGIDLTPHYVIPYNAAIFHNDLKNICDTYSLEFYQKFKSWADDYFFNAHRCETRGIGGIFFDHLSHKSTLLPKETLFEFCMELGKAFPKIYKKQVELGKNIEISEINRTWQQLRRGRYVEFNLVHDRGTKFGLISGGRTESILLSMPPTANWVYGYQAFENSAEQETLDWLRKDVDWLSFMNN